MVMNIHPAYITGQYIPAGTSYPPVQHRISYTRARPLQFRCRTSTLNMESSQPNVTSHNLNQTLHPNGQMAALILLNGPTIPIPVLELTWPLTTKVNYPTICADGAANLLHSINLQTQNNTNHDQTQRIPTHIVGDLDSVTQQNINYYKDLGTKVIHDPDQDANDFQKSLSVAKSYQIDSNLPIVVIGGFGGRIDQTLSNLNTLFSHAQSGHTMIWMDDKNVIIALSPGHHQISIDSSTQGPICGLIPVGSPVENVTTSGLKWNLSSQKLAYGIGNIVSSSNQVISDHVLIETSSPIMFTLELRLNDKQI